MRQELPHYPGDSDEGDISPWRPYLAYGAFCLVVTAVNVAFLLALRAAPPWLRDNWRLSMLGWALLQVVTLAVAIEVAAVIHPRTARELEFSSYRAPDHESPRRRESRFTRRHIAAILFSYAFTLLVVWLAGGFTRR